MLFINSPKQFASGTYGRIEGETNILAIPSIRQAVVKRFATVGGETNILAVGISRNEGAVVFIGETNILAIGRVGLSLASPPPILTEIAADAFTSQRLRVRFFIDDVSVQIKSFEYSKPRNTLGSKLSIILAKPDPSLFDSASSFKFEIGKFVSGSWQDFVLVENGSLDTQNFNLSANGDQLSFSSIEPLADRLELCPRQNSICYDSAKISLSLDETEPLADHLGNSIPTILRPINGLTLYQLLEIAFVEGCGFDSFSTNIPNFQVTRCDFSISNSYLEAVSSILGVFEPVIFAVDNEIWLLDRTQAVPDDFEPNTLTASKMTTFSASKASQAQLDGFLLNFTDSDSGTYSTNRVVQFTNATGDFGDPDFTETEVTQTFKDWRNDAVPNVVVKSDLVSEIQETTVGSEIVGRTTETHTFDGQGKRTETRKVFESLIPDLSGGSPSLAIVREEIQQFFYKNDRTARNRFVLDKSILRVSGLIAIDTENQYLGNDFRQDFLAANGAGNLSEGMTTETGAIKTVIETLDTLGNGQVQSKILTIDHLRNAVTNSLSDVRAGDISLNSISKTRQVVVWREGINLADQSGARVVPFSVGELPLYFAIPLAERRLARSIRKPLDATIEVLGFDENLDRGVYFAAVGRSGADLGKFLTEGLSVRGGENSPITTTIEASEI